MYCRGAATSLSEIISCRRFILEAVDVLKVALNVVGDADLGSVGTFVGDICTLAYKME